MWSLIEKYSEEDFKRHTGVSRAVFSEMVSVLEVAATRKKKRGRPQSFGVEDQLLIAFEYWREYRTYFHRAHSWKTQESTVCRIVRRVEDALMSDKKFHLPGKKALLQENTFEVVVVDATESPIERPKKKQKRNYSGKKKRHTLKTQVAVDRKSQRIIATAHGSGSCHDFKLLKDSRTRLHPDTEGLFDSGYQGQQKRQKQTRIPHKKTKKHPLTKEQKAANRALARERILAEHVIRRLKIFRILKHDYRNRRKRFALRCNLIAAIYNRELEKGA